ncbi:MAG: ABC transporter permease [Acidobacteria bacterium]|nr:ABC transporter permease [Acidobacteriota bacterium]
MLTDLLYRLRALFRKDAMNDELREELAYHLEREAQKHAAAGASPTEAMRRARLSLGGTAQVEQRVRDQRGVRLWDECIADLRFALRQLRRSPGFTITAVLTLALSIGATVTMFRIVRSTLLEPLPYPQQDRLVGVAFAQPQQSPNDNQAGNTANFLLQHAKSFQSASVYTEGTSGANLATGAQTAQGAVQVAIQSIDRNFFPTLGVQPMLGRNFSVDEDRRNGPKAIILSYGLWQRMFNGDASIVNRVVHLNGESATVVGVMPATMVFGSDSARSLSPIADIWQPLALDTADPGYYGTNYNMLARLRDGVTVVQAQQEVASLNQPLYKEFPFLTQWLSVAKTIPEFKLWPLQQVLVSNIHSSIVALTAAVLAVLLVACLNLAGLNAARAASREREIALRTALGASRLEIVRLLVSESFLLAIAGTALGLGVASVMLPALMASAPMVIPRASGAHLAALFAITVVLVFAVTLLCGLLPSWLVLRRSAAANLHARQSAGATAPHGRMSKALLVSQTAIAVLLLSAAALLLAVFLRLRTTPSGVQPQHLAVAQVNLKGRTYASTLATTQFIQKVVDRLQQYPGVKQVAASNGFPLDRGLNITMPPAGALQKSDNVELRLVTPGYFETVGMPLLAGRDIAASDGPDAPPVIVVSQAIANKLWPGKSPVEEHVKAFFGKNSPPLTVIGVVADSHTHSLAEDPALLIFEPFAQQTDKSMKTLNGWFRTSFAIRSATGTGLAAAVQQAIHEADPDIPISRYTTMQALIDNSLARPRFFSSLVTAFAGFALALTVIGLFGLLSYQVTQRTREIGVRIALGSTRRQVLGFIMRRGLVLTAIGLAIGSAASLFLPRLIHSVMNESVYTAEKGAVGMLSTLPALAVACGAMLVAAVAASYLPARRASAIEPMEALRTE